MKNQTYEEFYLKYRKISKAYAYGILHDWNMADDVSQDVLYKMYNMRCTWCWKDFVKNSLLIMKS